MLGTGGTLLAVWFAVGQEGYPPPLFLFSAIFLTLTILMMVVGTIVFYFAYRVRMSHVGSEVTAPNTPPPK